MSTAQTPHEIGFAWGYAGRPLLDLAWEVERLLQTDAFEDELRAAHAGYDAGVVAYIAQHWAVRWTTAPANYDGFGTTVLTQKMVDGRLLRQVAIDPSYLSWQEGRYHSGLHACSKEAP